MREALLHALQANKRIHVLGCAGTLESARAAFRKERPDVLLVAPVVNCHDPFEVCRAIKKLWPEIKIVFRANAQTHELSTTNARNARVHGFLQPDCSLEDYTHAIFKAVEGRYTFEGWECEADGEHPERTFREGDAELTPKEKEVEDLVRQGRTSKEIATMMSKSVRTIEGRRQRVLAKRRKLSGS